MKDFYFKHAHMFTLLSMFMQVTEHAYIAGSLVFFKSLNTILICSGWFRVYRSTLVHSVLEGGTYSVGVVPAI